MKRVEGTTVLTGTVVDQAHLHGCIERPTELGLEQLGEPVGLTVRASTQGKGK